MAPRGTGRVGLFLLLGAGLVGCSDSGSADPTAPSLDPVTTVVTTTAPVVTTATTAGTVSTSTTEPVTTESLVVESSAESVPETSTSTTEAPVTTEPGITGPMFSDALGTKVDTAPGVNTPGDTRELMPGLWVHIAWEPDPNDPSVFTVQPGDEEILEAYANARRVYYEAATTTVDISSPEWAEYYLDAGEQYREILEDRTRNGERRDLDLGVVIRPYIPVDQRTATSAVVLDCQLDGSVWRESDGSL